MDGAPGEFASHNNRQQWYRVYDGVHPSEPTDVTNAIEEVMVKYDEGGHPFAIVRKLAEDPTFRALRMNYDSGGQLWLAESYEWTVDAFDLPENVTRTAAREFRYDSGRARYMFQDRDPLDLDVLPSSTQWTHYDGDSPYSDYLPNATSDGFDEGRRYLPGIAQIDPDPVDPALLSAEYTHSDQIGSLRALTDDFAALVREVIQTAFGVSVSSSGTSDTRYGFVGESGYEEGLLPGWDFLHVGARWYDPDSGRFLQRDPMGIEAGLNVYEYVDSRPTTNIDPLGLMTHDTNTIRIWIRDERRSGKSHSETMNIVVQAHGKALVGGIVAASAGKAVRPVVRWLNRGKLRIGLSRHKGKLYICLRYKNKHLIEVPVPKGMEEIYK